MPSGRTCRYAFGFLVLLISLHLSAQDMGAIIGQIRISRGSFPNRRIEVNLEARGARVASTYSDDEGRFSFPGLLANLYHVIINDGEYYPIDEIVTHNPSVTRTNILSIYLTPKSDSSVIARPVRPGANPHTLDNTESGRSQQPGVAGGNPYLVNLAEYSKKFPKAVIKEFDKGTKRDREGDLDSAIEHYQKALKIAPEFYPARNDLGSVYLKKGDFAAAEREFNEVLRLNPSDATAYFNLGNVALLTKRFPEGLRYVDEGLKKHPNSGTGLFIQGSLLRQTGRFLEAERALRQALAADPSLSRAHLELVNLYRQQERKGDLIAELQAFLRLFPTDPLAPRVKETLFKLGVPTDAR
jgi:Flp pilus assembly protein TadD